MNLLLCLILSDLSILLLKMILPLVLILILIIINYYSYSYYCVINQKNFLLLFGIRNKNTMKAELIFDD